MAENSKPRKILKRSDKYREVCLNKWSTNVLNKGFPHQTWAEIHGPWGGIPLTFQERNSSWSSVNKTYAYCFYGMEGAIMINFFERTVTIKSASHC